MYAKSSGEDTLNIAGQKIPSLSKRLSRLALEHHEKIPSMMGLDTLSRYIPHLAFCRECGDWRRATHYQPIARRALLSVTHCFLSDHSLDKHFIDALPIHIDNLEAMGVVDEAITFFRNMSK